MRISWICPSKNDIYLAPILIRSKVQKKGSSWNYFEDFVRSFLSAGCLHEIIFVFIRLDWSYHHSALEMTKILLKLRWSLNWRSISDKNSNVISILLILFWKPFYKVTYLPFSHLTSFFSIASLTSSIHVYLSLTFYFFAVNLVISWFVS